MEGLLKDKVAIVTGAGRGLGRSYAIQLAKEGAKLVVNDLGCAVDGTGSSREPADSVVQEIRELGGIAVADYNTVATSTGGNEIIKNAINSFGKVDILVNNAGIDRPRMVFNMSDDDWEMVIKTHLFGHFYCTRSACVFMKQQKSGRIINVSSLGVSGNPGQANYCSAKAGILGFTRTIAKEMGRVGVTCNAIIPVAPTRLSFTPEVRAVWEKKKATGDIVAIEFIKMMTETSPDDAAPLVAYLASDAAASINGYTFHIQKGEISVYGDPAPIKMLNKMGRWTADELVAVMPGRLGQVSVHTIGE